MIKDILDLVRDLGAAAKETVQGAAGVADSVVSAGEALRARRGVLSRSRSMTAFFPLVVSQGVDAENAMSLARAVEVEYAMALSRVFQADGLIDIRKGETKASIFSRFHTNVDDGAVWRSIREDAQARMAPEGEWLNKPPLALLAEADPLGPDPWKHEKNGGRVPPQGAAAQDPAARKDKADPREDPTVAAIQQKEWSTVAKKQGGLDPLSLQVTIPYRLEGQIQETRLEFGVKVVMHPIPSDAMCYYVAETLRENDVMFKIARWVTGEIEFAKDLILAVRQSRELAAGSSAAASGGDPSSQRAAGRWFGRLRSMASSARVAKMLSTRDMLPNATLVLSLQDAATIRSRYGVDLKQPAEADRLCRLLFLLRLVIMDDASEVLMFYDEGSTSWQGVTYSALQKEAKRSEVKEVLSAIGANRR